MQTIDSFKANVEMLELCLKNEIAVMIARSVQQGGKQVTAEQVVSAKLKEQHDQEIHDTVLIAAAFCMFNRYVDGLATWAPDNRQFYVDRAPRRAAEGYIDFDL